MSGWTDVWQLIQEAASAASLVQNPAGLSSQIGQSGTAGNTVISGAESGAGAWGAITGFLVAITDWHLWASVGWILLGLALIIMGARIWLGKSALPAPPIPVPV